MEKKELYVSIEPGEYRENKANLLNSQADILRLMKHSQEIGGMENQRLKLKIKLYKLFSDLIKKLEELEQKLPTPKIPKSITKSSNVSGMDIQIKETSTQYQSIERELLEIQDKLEELNR